jgi:hypothetical protein
MEIKGLRLWKEMWKSAEFSTSSSSMHRNFPQRANSYVFLIRFAVKKTFPTCKFYARGEEKDIGFDLRG